MYFKTLTFDSLNTMELYRIMQLRLKIFVVEQDCVYMDLDDLDLNSIHVLGYENDELLCYARILTGDLYNDGYVHIGRVAVEKEYRAKKFGYKLMQFCIDYCNNNLGKDDIKISAQEHLQNFYNNLGFKKVGTIYLEDNIPHIGMIRLSDVNK